MNKKIDYKTKKAIIQTPKEIRKLTNAVTLIGKAMVDKKIRKIRKKQDKINSLGFHERGVT
ncbi:MAG: hypothetical protein Q7K34_02365 [archaeon]|nr:hypothetical protein [archaeon]